MSAPVHVVRVVLGPSQRDGITSVQVMGRPPQYYLDHEAPSSGVCLALDAVASGVGRGEIAVGEEGLVVRVEIQRKGSSGGSAA